MDNNDKVLNDDVEKSLEEQMKDRLEDAVRPG